MEPELPHDCVQQRIHILGTTGSGKTTVAGCAARRLHIPHIELDALHWGSHWTAPPPEIFRSRVSQALTGPAWVIDGNYSEVRALIWQRANTVVWLDLPLTVILWRLLRRTWTRIRTREVLWNTNQESFREAFLSKDSIILYALQSSRRQRQRYPLLFSNSEFTHIHFIHLHSQQDIDAWLESIQKDGELG